MDAEATTIPAGSDGAKAVLSGGGVDAAEEPAEAVIADPVEDKAAEPAHAPIAKRVDERDGKLDDAPLDESVKGPSDGQVGKGPAGTGPAAKGPGGKNAVADGPGPAGKKSSSSKRRGRDKRPSKPQAGHPTGAAAAAAKGGEKAAERRAAGSTSSSAGTAASAKAKETGATTVSPTVESGPGKLASRLLGRLRDGDASKGAFITTEGHCSVCQKGFTAGSEEQLEQSDWTVNGDVGQCPECRGDGWQLPEGARLPFRRGGG